MELQQERPDGSQLHLDQRRPWRALLRACAALATGIIATIAVAGAPAHAAPMGPAEIEQQINTLWNTKLEPVIEQRNKVVVELGQNQAKAAKLAEQIKPLQDKYDAAMAMTSAIAAEAYKGGQASKLSAVLGSGSPTVLIERMSLLGAIARDQQAKVADTVKVKAQYEEQKRPLDAVIATLAAQQAEIDVKKKAIDAEIANLNQLRLQAYGTTNSPGALRPEACPTSYDGSPGARAAQVACAQAGKPYVWAAEGPGSFDCSGLTLYAWKAVGVSLPHYTGWQWDQTTRVARANIAIGDLVFFYSDLHHVGIYVGNGWMMHAPVQGVPVQMAKIDSYPIAGFGRPG